MKKYLFISIIIFLLCFSYVTIIHLFMYKTAREVPPDNISHIIVLGAKLNGDVMSLSLNYRVRAALTYLQENEETRVIVSGGQGEGEWITEAEAMARFFVESGISEDRIIREETSTNTFENIKFSRQIVGEDVRELVIVTSDYHLLRSMMIAKRHGFEPYPLAAKTPFVVKGKLWVREYIAIVKTWIFDR